MDLHDYFLMQQGARIMKNAHYFEIYERHLRRFVGHPVTMFEIGTGQGGACRMWKNYFGPKSTIVTIDIDDKARFAEPQVHPRRGDQADHAFLQSLVDEFGAPDIILDDGSHEMHDINASFDFLFPAMSPRGTYVIEDIDGAYWPSRGGGPGHPNSIIERAKNLIDDMNSIYRQDRQTDQRSTRDIYSIAFYQMILVIERTPQLNRTLMNLPT